MDYSLVVLVPAVIGGLVAWLGPKLAPESTGSGIPHIKAVMINLRVLRWKKLLLAKITGLTAVLFAGFSLGREGPTIQLGAAVGSAITKIFGLPRRTHNHLVACGAGASLAAAFNTPLAGFIFVIEELRRELSPITYTTALIAAVCADIVSISLIGDSPSFDIHDFPVLPTRYIWFMIVLGILCGLLGFLFKKTLLLSLKYNHEKIKLHKFSKGALVGLIVGMMAFLLPEAIGSGHQMTEEILRTGTDFVSSIPFIFSLLVAKFLLTILCYVTGVPGGIFTPILSIGALFGVALGSLISLLYPAMAADIPSIGLFAMAAMLTAVIQAPLTSVILIIEMTGNYDLLYPLMVCCLCAYLTVRKLNSPPIYDTLMTLALGYQSPDKAAQSDEPVIMDFVVEPGSRMDRCQIRHLDLPKGALLVTLTRHGKDMVPRGDTYLKPGDQVALVVQGEATAKIQEIKNFASQTVWHKE